MNKENKQGYYERLRFIFYRSLLFEYLGVMNRIFQLQYVFEYLAAQAEPILDSEWKLSQIGKDSFSEAIKQMEDILEQLIKIKGQLHRNIKNLYKRLENPSQNITHSSIQYLELPVLFNLICEYFECWLNILSERGNEDSAGLLNRIKLVQLKYFQICEAQKKFWLDAEKQAKEDARKREQINNPEVSPQNVKIKNFSFIDDLADVCGVTHRTIHNWKKDNQPLSRDILEQIIIRNKLHMSATELEKYLSKYTNEIFNAKFSFPRMEDMRRLSHSFYRKKWPDELSDEWYSKPTLIKTIDRRIMDNARKISLRHIKRT